MSKKPLEGMPLNANTILFTLCNSSEEALKILTAFDEAGIGAWWPIFQRVAGYVNTHYRPRTSDNLWSAACLAIETLRKTVRDAGEVVEDAEQDKAQFGSPYNQTIHNAVLMSRKDSLRIVEDCVSKHLEWPIRD